MKILFLNTNIGYGGASKMMATVANALSRKHDVSFLTFRSDEVKQELSQDVRHIHNPLYTHKNKIIEVFGQIKTLRRIIKKEKYDVAIAFLHPSHYMLVLSAIGTKTKILLSERADPISRIKNAGLFVKLVERIIQRADAYVFQSKGAMKAYPKRCQKCARVIVNAIPDKALPTHDPYSEQKRIVHVARMELIQKRQDVMLSAFAEFHKKHPEYVLQFIGDGPQEDEMKKLAKELGIADYVQFMGERSDVTQFICDASMFVLTSDYEGLPNALLEAMAIGLPCISTDCSPGGARMIIKNGYNGFIVPCQDSKALAEKMAVLAEDGELRRTFSQRAAEVKAKFDGKCIDAQWLKFVEELG